MSEQLQLLPDPDGQPGSAAAAVPQDQPERDRIRSDLGSTLFVEAGAGSGKTTALVDRILALVDSGVALEHVAAITFTDKAAAELRQRVRDRLEAGLRESENAARRKALEQLDGAAISTLHAFAQRLLFEHPLEAGLPPGVEVLDEIASQVDFQDRWEGFLPELLAEEALAGPLLIAEATGVRLASLRHVATQFEDNWDLLAQRLPEDLGPLTIDAGSAIEAMRDLLRHRSDAIDGTDKLVERLDEVEGYALALDDCAARAETDLDALVDLAELLVADDPAFAKKSDGAVISRLGNKGNWPKGHDLDAIKQELFEAGELRNAARQTMLEGVIARLALAVGRFVLDGVAERRAEGRLRFHDLLVLARELLRHPETGAEVRNVVRDRYRVLLIDEFQDTDPIQVDIASLIAAVPGESQPERWEDVEVEPGRLFFVGDPKQSIYRFRRADIATYLRAQARFGGATPGGNDGHVALSTNFRSSAPVLGWVNATFGRLIEFRPDSQPPYRELAGVRAAPKGGPGVRVLGEAPIEGALGAAELRRIEAAAVADTVVEAVTAGWTVADDEGADRPARLGDITILLPARTSLGALELALENAGIPYRAETASLVYSTPEVRDLVMIARAIDDPGDELSVVAALRTPAMGCGDDDLYRHRVEQRLGWNHQGLPDEAPPSPAVDGLRWLAELHAQRAWLSPAQVLDRIVSERALLQLGVVQERHREVWRRLRFVVDQARAWTDATSGDLRGYLGWVHLQASESARVAETVLPETDTDAVRIMTIHASKGLEFPITIVSGMTTQLQGAARGVRVVFPPDGGIGYRLGKDATTPEYEQFMPLDEQLDVDERLRLLYVACTRASDHLVVSAVRATEQRGTSFAKILAPPAIDDETSVGAPDGPAFTLAGSTPTAVTAEPPTVDDWERRRTAALGTATRTRTVAATTLAHHVAQDPEPDPGHAKAARNQDLPPWQKGRYGTSIGRAVHGVLQTVDLSDPEQVPAAAAAQATAEGVVGSEDSITARCLAAMASPVVREAVDARYWREMFVAAPVGDRLLEGYIDLLFTRGDDLVVVDYKTDAWHDDADLDAKVERYRLQAAAYAAAIEAATDRTVADAVLLFLDDDRAVARSVPGLRDAIADVHRLVPEVIVGGEEATADV